MKTPTNVTDLDKGRNYDAKLSEIESQCFTTSDYNKFTNEIIDNKIKERKLVKKSDISRFIDSTNLDKKIATLTTEPEFKAEKDKITKITSVRFKLFFKQRQFCR